MVALQLEKGKLVLLLEDNNQSISLTVKRNITVADGEWHYVHVRIDKTVKNI